jgi:uncharacterized protein YndB with AHSA1/START domain
VVDVAVEIEIARPRAEVFAYVVDVENDAAWTTGLVRAEKKTEGPLQPGSRIARVSRFLGRELVYDIEIVGVEPDRALVMKTSSGPFPMAIRYELEDAPGGTRMRIRTQGEASGFFKLTGPLLSAAVKRQIGLDLAHLKDLLEAGA